MAKQTHNDVFTNTFMKTDYFKEQRELYLKNKAEIDERRRREQEKKRILKYQTYFPIISVMPRQNPYR